MKTIFPFPFLASICLLLCFPLYGNDSTPDSIVETMADTLRFQIQEAPAFQNFENRRYQDSLFVVEKISDICYAKSPGFWSEIDDNTPAMGKILHVVDVRRTVPLDLCLDIYRPQNDTLEKRPMVMLIYGGAY